MSDQQHGEVEALRAELAQLQASAAASERRLRVSHAVGRVLAEEASLELAVPKILGALGGSLGCAVAEYHEPDHDRLTLRGSWHASDVPEAWVEHSRELAFERGDGLAGRIWAARGPVWFEDVAKEKALRRHEALRDIGARSAFGFPVTAGADLLGVISLFTREHELADDHLAEVLRTIGGHFGQYIANVRSYAAAAATARELEHERHTLSLLNDIARKIGAELDVEHLAQSVIDVATLVTGAQFGAFFFTAGEVHGESFMHHVVGGVAKETFARFAVPRATALLAPTFNGRPPVRIDDVLKDPRYGKNLPHRGIPDGHPPVRSYLAVPVLSRTGATLGALFFGHAQPSQFTEREQRIAVQLASHAATALDNARLFSEQQRLIKELEKTNVELDQFAYAASHDLRAPLRGISNLAGWIEEDLGTSTPKKVREHIAMLKGRAARMDKLISGLLELARVGRVRQKPERVDVTELLHETIDLLSPPEASRILIIGAMPMIVAERVALQQVFLNLIGNSIQHGGRSDIVVRISSTERADDHEFSVADNGVGIPPEHHERVWQIFQTLQARDVLESTGIGLSIVKKQVEANGGRAWIEPHPKEGATLKFTWPKRPR